MSGQTEIVDLLSRPETYGIATPVERIETHASAVFLAGDRVYKLKKAVRFSFLDYSTAALRQAACAAEYRINCAIAPTLYLGVVPITRASDGLTLDGPGEAADWVLVMRRFDAADRLDRVADRGMLSPALLRALADRVAKIHGAAPVRIGLGGAVAMRSVASDVARNLRPAVPQVLAAPSVDRWSVLADRALERIAAVLDRRRQARRVRACHGDLHLENLCLVDGQPTPFDAIEFNEALSSIDVLYDLAFLLMDLERRGLRPAANLVLNRYLDRRDEADGLVCLPFFLSLRAAVRAEVVATTMLQQGETGDQAQAYLDLALRLTEPQKPTLLAIGGFSGTGKSTLAYGLAPGLGAAPGARVIRSDVLRKRASGVGPEDRLPASSYSPEARAATYRLVQAEARTCLAAGHSVIVDAVHARPEDRAALVQLAVACGVRFRGLWLDAPIALLEARLRDRRDDASDATVAVLHEQLAQDIGPCDWRPIDAGDSPAAVLSEALRI